MALINKNALKEKSVLKADTKFFILDPNTNQANAGNETITWENVKAEIASEQGAFTDVISTTDTTDATSKDTGSIITEGGIGVEKAIYAGTSITATTTVKAGNGAVGTPSFSFINSADMGLYRVSGTQMGISVAGSLQAVVDSTLAGLSLTNIYDRVIGSYVGLFTQNAPADGGTNSSDIYIEIGNGSSGDTQASGDGGLFAASAGDGGFGGDGFAGGAGGDFELLSGSGGSNNSTGAEDAGAAGNLTISAGNGGNATAGTGDGGKGGSVILDPGAGGTTVGGVAGKEGNIILRGITLQKQPAPTAKTTSTTMTAAEVLAGIITVNQGAAGASAQQLPTGADLTAALPDATTNDSFDFTVINTSVVAAEDASITTNTDWTLFGSMVIEANDSDRAASSGRFRARKTGANTWSLYRIS